LTCSAYSHQVDDHGGKQQPDAVVLGVVDVAHDEGDVERQRQHDEKVEHDSFEIHPRSPLHRPCAMTIARASA
jgi:hypothetical protein